MLADFKNGRNGTESARRINQNLGQDVVNECTVQLWFQKFRSQNNDLIDKDRSGRPSVLDDDALLVLVEEDPRLTVRDIANILNCRKTTATRRLKALNMVKKFDKWVLQILNENQKERRRVTCLKLLERYKNEPFFN